MKNNDVAITGMSCFFPGAKNINQFWNNLINGVDSITEVPNEVIDSVYFKNNNNSEPNRFYSKRGGFIPNITIDAEKFNISSSEINDIDPSHLLSLKLIHQALEDASVFSKNISLKNCALLIGKGNYAENTDLKTFDIVHTSEQIAEIIKEALPNLSEEEVNKVKKEFQAKKGDFNKNTASGQLPNSLTSLIANKLNIQGASYTIDAACASSLVAIEHAIQELVNNHSDIAIAGGVHFSQNSPFWAIFNQLQLLSKKEQMKPFSIDADGLLIGEGAGFIVLKKLDQAIADNDKIYAVIKGIGISNSGSYSSITAPSSEGQKNAVNKALKKANVNPDNVSYIEAYGLATPSSDIVELDTISEVFNSKNRQEKILLGSIKSNIGHTMSASGIAGIIKTALSLYHREVPPTLHCDKPIEKMEENNIQPVQKTTSLNKNTALFAGVNAFGFGGINAHAVLTNYKTEVVNKKNPVFQDKAIAVSAPDKDTLLNLLDKKEFSFHASHDYKLILFNPTDDRIDKAKKLISKDRPWKGRQDIWFSNKPLLKNQEKIAFLFAGFDPSSESELESIANYFNKPIPDTSGFDRKTLIGNSFRQLYASSIIDSALKELGVYPDLNAGHSLGEWFAAQSAGYFTNETVDNLLLSMGVDNYDTDDAYFIAVTCSSEKAQPWLDNIPDLYLSNDNCPSQILLCGNEKAKDILIKKLKEGQFFYQVLDFKSGFHSPFIKDRLYVLDEKLKYIEILKNKIPVLSATTLEAYPDNLQGFRDLTVNHLTGTVRFRQLVEKLYHKDQTRVFIQIGSGPLIGFVDDTLKSKEYSAISASINTRSTLEQFRRILALLFIEGKDIDLSFIGINDESENTSSLNEVQVSVQNKLVKSLPILKELSAKSINTDNSQTNNFESLYIESDHPVVQAMNDNIRELILMQNDLAKIIKENKNFRRYTTPSTSIRKQQTEATTSHESSAIVSKIGKTFSEELYITLEDYPYVIDHGLSKQPVDWPDNDDRGIVIPMTMNFELLIEATQRQAPSSKKATQIGPISVFQWMEIGDTKIFDQTLQGVWKTEDTAALTIKNFANAEVTLKDSFEEIPAEYLGTIDLGEPILTPPTPEQIYKRHMFHGPAYQSIVEVTEITKKGLRAKIKKQKGKGSLLDAIGQLFGLYLQLTLEDAKVSFPVKIEEINFYQDIADQEGDFELTFLFTSLEDELATANIVIKRDDKVWCIVKDWKNMRFGFDNILWNLTMDPSEIILSQEIIPESGVYFYDNKYSKAVAWDFLRRIFLNLEERTHYFSLQLNKRKDYLISRITVKDAARSYIKKKFNKTLFPIEFSIAHDEKNKPSLSAPRVKEANGVTISLAHKGSNSVSIVSDKPVGIDIELIEERDQAFINYSFTEKEIQLLASKENKDEWITRLWVAKEAYGKMLGVGLKGNPKHYEVQKIEGENLIIDTIIIQTTKYNNLIIGWTH